MAPVFSRPSTPDNLSGTVSRSPRNGQSTAANAPVFSRQSSKSTPDTSIACNQITSAGADAMDQKEGRGQQATSRHTPPPQASHEQGATSHDQRATSHELGQQATARHQPTPHTTPHNTKHATTHTTPQGSARQPSGARGSTSHEQGAASHELGSARQPSEARVPDGSPGASSRESPGSRSSTRRSANRRAPAPSFATACSPPRTLQATPEVRYIYMHIYIHACIHTMIHTYTYTHSLSFSLSLSLSHTHTHSLSHSLTHSLSLTHTHTHTGWAPAS